MSNCPQIKNIKTIYEVHITDPDNQMCDWCSSLKYHRYSANRWYNTTDPNSTHKVIDPITLETMFQQHKAK